MDATTRLLLMARFWRSLAQGALVVDLSLYLHALHWRGAAIGGVLTGAGFFGAILSLWVGIVSDRYGRKPFLVAYELITCLCAVVALVTANPWLLAPAIIFAGFGRGANGAAGPFSPAEQAWLADAVRFESRGLIYSLNTSFGFIGMAIGALAAMLPSWWYGDLGPESYRLLFALVLLGNAINLLIIMRAKEKLAKSSTKRVVGEGATAAGDENGDAVATSKLTPPSNDAAASRLENRFFRRLIVLNTLNGLAIGLTGPLIAYWFAMRFGVGPAAIGPVLALTFLLTAGASVLTGLLTRRVGLVTTVIWGRSAGVCFLVMMPLMPLYLSAAALYVLRSIVNRSTTGARQALIVSVVRDRRRGLAVSVNIISSMLPMAIGPIAAGAMIGARWFATPFYIAAVLQALYVFYYGRLFAPFERRLQSASTHPPRILAVGAHKAE